MTMSKAKTISTADLAARLGIGTAGVHYRAKVVGIRPAIPGTPRRPAQWAVKDLPRFGGPCVRLRRGGK
jgi:hypothetical protein